MYRKLLFLCVFFFPVMGLAQARFHAGLALGKQAYGPSIGNPRVLTSADVLIRGESLGLHVAGEYADLADEGALIVTHPDLVYRRNIGTNGWFGLIGAGPTFATVGSLGHRTTWNAEAELGFARPRTEFLARLRQYDFSVRPGRAGESGPEGPAMYVGVRFRLSK